MQKEIIRIALESQLRALVKGKDSYFKLFSSAIWRALSKRTL